MKATRLDRRVQASTCGPRCRTSDVRGQQNTGRSATRELIDEELYSQN